MTLRTHKPSGAYLPVGQLDGDCREGEDEPAQCDLCDAVLFYGYDNGAGIERGWVAP